MTTAAQKSMSEEIETDDNLVRLWQDELRDVQEKIEVYRSDGSIGRAFGADQRSARAVLATLPQRIVERRMEIAYERWAQENLAGLTEIPVASLDRRFVSVKKEDLTVLAPALAVAIPKKSRLWANWSVWNFKRHPLHRARSLPAEAVRRARGSLMHFERLEVWRAVGMADPWLVGVMRGPAGRARFYLLYEWGLETTRGRDSRG